jgi:hypothetical protein
MLTDRWRLGACPNHVALLRSPPVREAVKKLKIDYFRP